MSKTDTKLTELEEPRRLPLYEQAFETLDQAGKIDYGVAVLWPEFCDMLGVQYDGGRVLMTWGFRKEFIGFRQCCQDLRGMIVTERGENEQGFRFLKREELLSYVRQRELKKAQDSMRKSGVLSQCPRDGLDAQYVARMEHLEAKTAFLASIQMRLLRQRKLPTVDPAHAVKMLVGENGSK